MKTISSFLVLICLVTCPVLGIAYNRDTHVKITQAAVYESVLAQDPSVLADLGITLPLNQQSFPNSENTSEDIVDLFMDGARFEDNNIRARNHFFDPVYDRPLTVLCCGELGSKSPDWALEDLGDISSQDFSLKDARGYFYKALTSPTQVDRDTNFGLTFQTLGQVVHHIQDMAQPQHVRNDVHMDELSLVGLNPLYNPSFYELFTNLHLSLLPLSGTVVHFPNPRDFWTNAGGTGMAQFTNRNFVSEGTNFQLLNGQIAPNSTYPSPAPIGAETPVDIQTLFADANLPPALDQNGNPLQGDIVFVGSNVDGAPNPLASSLSIFDQDLAKYHTTYVDNGPSAVYGGSDIVVDRAFTLNQFNFRAAYPFLIPKAVGYSAGLIDYFFRGKTDLNIDYDSTTVDQYQIQNQGQEDMTGSFTLYYDGVDGLRHPVAGDTTDITWNNVTIPANGTSPPLMPPILPSNPKPQDPHKYILVFKGQMGDEKPDDKLLDAQSVGAVVAKSNLSLLWEPWRIQLTDDHPWLAGGGSVDNIVGPSSENILNGQLVEQVGVDGVADVSWQAASPADVISARYMKIRLYCSQNTLTENDDVYAYVNVGPNEFETETMSFAGGLGSIGTNGYQFPRSTTPQEYIIDLWRLGFYQIGWVDIATIGFDMDLTCSIDYIDFSENPFDKVAPGAIQIPWE